MVPFGHHSGKRRIEEEPLRVFIGIIVGILLTIGTAYVADSLRPGTGSTGTEVAARPMVNWDVVGDNFRSLSTKAQEAWTRLTKGNT
jgi:hypothetical protein